MRYGTVKQFKIEYMVSYKLYLTKFINIEKIYRIYIKGRDKLMFV